MGGHHRRSRPPQELINEDLRQCDYAIFVLHDRWGTPTGSGHTSGTEEEWEIAEGLYKGTKVRKIALFFKDVDAHQLRDPGAQLKKVLEFKDRIREGKRYLFKAYARQEDFCECLEAHLAKWLRDHTGSSKSPASGDLASIGTPVLPEATPTPAVMPSAPPSFDYWIAEGEALLYGESQNLEGALFAPKGPWLPVRRTPNGRGGGICQAQRNFT